MTLKTVVKQKETLQTILSSHDSTHTIFQEICAEIGITNQVESTHGIFSLISLADLRECAGV